MKRQINSHTYKGLEWAIYTARATQLRNSYKACRGEASRREGDIVKTTYYLVKLYLEIGGNRSDILDYWEEIKDTQTPIKILPDSEK